MGLSDKAGNNVRIIRQGALSRKGRHGTTHVLASIEAESKDPPRSHEGHEEEQVWFEDDRAKTLGYLTSIALLRDLRAFVAHRLILI
jgi:hypothetical protein